MPYCTDFLLLFFNPHIETSNKNIFGKILWDHDIFFPSGVYSFHSVLSLCQYSEVPGIVSVLDCLLCLSRALFPSIDFNQPLLYFQVDSFCYLLNGLSIDSYILLLCVDYWTSSFMIPHAHLEPAKGIEYGI